MQLKKIVGDDQEFHRLHTQWGVQRQHIVSDRHPQKYFVPQVFWEYMERAKLPDQRTAVSVPDKVLKSVLNVPYHISSSEDQSEDEASASKQDEDSSEGSSETESGDDEGNRSESPSDSDHTQNPIQH